MADSELSAKQIRARHAVPSNSADFSTRHGGTGGGSINIILIVVLLLVAGAGLYFVIGK